MVIGVAPSIDSTKTCVKRDEVAWSTYGKHFKLNGQHIVEKGEELYDFLMNTIIFTLIINKIFKRAKNIMRKATTNLDLLCIMP